MASDQSFVDYVCEQLRDAHDISARKMFGEYAIYSTGKVVALVCDNRLFIKPTVAGRNLLSKPVEAPPYPGAKPFFVADAHLDNAEFMSALIVATANELPVPKKKTASVKKGTSPAKSARKATKTSSKSKTAKPRKK